MENENMNLFSKLDIRVGKIIRAEEFKEATKPAYILSIDFGDDVGIKKTSAQITNYTLKELLNKSCIGVINLGDKQIGPIMSQCLVLGSISSNGNVLLLEPDTNAKLGDKIS
tara:strand:- start:213 stop:548 length:336 start_codon:yes stop_codon:yes gene_type:complete